MTAGEMLKNVMNQSMPGALFQIHPSEYSSVYPYNMAWTTVGGFEVEVDNGRHSHGKTQSDPLPRLRYYHPKIANIEVHPDGVTTFMTMNDAQIISKKELHLKSSNELHAVDKKFHLQNETTQIESSEKFVAAAPNVNLASSEGISITAPQANVMGVDTAILSSGLSTSVTSMGNCEVSATGNVLINGANIIMTALAGITMIIGGTVVNLNVSGVSALAPKLNAVIPGAVTSVTGPQNASISGMKNENVGGIFKVNSSLVSLN
jgi:hypothetical protein